MTMPDADTIAATVRAQVDRRGFAALPKDTLDYAAGLFDADGSVAPYTMSISQAQRGVACLHFVYDHFGGCIDPLQHDGKEEHQQAYEWRISGKAALEFAEAVIGALLLKKREVAAFIEYQRSSVREERDELAERMHILKHVEHDAIPASVTPSDAYFGGFTDGEGCFDTHGKSCQHHSITQSWRAICDVYERRWGGKIGWSKRKKAFTWTIHVFADEFLRAVAPYIVGKKAQVDLILAMKPGEAMDVHCKLRELKGNYTRATPKIDAYLAGDGPTFKFPAKQLPRGVHANADGKFTVMLRHKKVEYNLGTFATVEEAATQYRKYKGLVEAEKRGGPAVDLAFNTREQRLLKLEPPPPGTVLPKGIYLTPFNTYQTRYHPGRGRKPVQLGTHRTLQAAIDAQARYVASLPPPCVNPPHA